MGADRSEYLCIFVAEINENRMGKKEEYKEQNLQFLSEMAGQEGVVKLPCGVLYKEIEKEPAWFRPD